MMDTASSPGREEREACAALCDAFANMTPPLGDDWGHYNAGARAAAQAIRARGEGGGA